MTTGEMRELDAWIFMNLFGAEYRLFNRHDKTAHLVTPQQITSHRGMWQPTSDSELDNHAPFYSTDPAAAMMVLKRCAEKTDQVSVVECAGVWCVAEGEGFAVEAEAPTIELAICLFAKSLFSQTERKEG